MNLDQNKLEAMTVNERLSHLGLIAEFDQAVASGQLQDVVNVLRKAKLTDEQAQETAQTLLSNPKKYGF